jgi:hypothetical protein
VSDIENGELDALLRAFSPGRMEPYVRFAEGRLDSAFRLYAWNVEVSAAFAGPLHCLEVVLRNAMHRALIVHFGQEDWWSHPRIELHRSASQSIRGAAEKLGRLGKETTADRVVAELSLGFWVALLGKGVNYETRLWRPALRSAFPYYVGERAALHEELETMRRLRNRISHLEPIHNRHHHADHQKILRIVAYISPAAVSFIRRHDRVPFVVRRRSLVCAGSADPSF